jgi:magnesium transporter
MPPGAAASLVAALRTDLAAAILRRLDEASTTAILAQLPSDDARLLRAVLRYPDSTAGALMDPRVIAACDDVTVGEARATLHRSPRDMHGYLYVVDRTHRLTGAVALRELMLARPAEPLAAIMSSPAARLSARMGRAAIAGHPGWRRFHALPVVDEESRLVGAIRYETFRMLEDSAPGRPRRPEAVNTVFALGELYWLGLAGVLDGLASAMKGQSSRARAGEGNHGAS